MRKDVPSRLSQRLKQVVVVAPTCQTNALGRAVAVTNFFKNVGIDVVIVAPSTRNVWVGLDNQAASSLTSVFSFLSGNSNFSPTKFTLIVGVKPLPATAFLISVVSRVYPNNIICLDQDDADADLSHAFFAQSLRNKAGIIRHPQMASPAIKRTTQWLYDKVDFATVSTFALANHLKIPLYLPIDRLPHIRIDSESPHMRQSGLDWNSSLSVGFFGTLRPHKGTKIIEQLLAADLNWKLHLFSGQKESSRLLSEYPERVVLHAPKTPLSTVYSYVNCSLLPQETNNDGALYQLPAKLMDSLRYAVPVLGTPTPAISEVSGQALIPCNSLTDYLQFFEKVRDNPEILPNLLKASSTQYSNTCTVESVLNANGMLSKLLRVDS